MNRNNPAILFLDIETAPNIATVWAIWDQNIALNQLLETSYVLCWAAKWKHSKTILFDSVQKSGKVGVIKSIYKIINEADIIVHFNGRRFDIPTLNKEFLLLGLNPPAPYRQIDLYQTVKKRFKFVSNKLAHITKQLGFAGKIPTTHELWLQCMNGDKAAWKKMELYNKRDTTELEKVYNRILPWIENHPGLGIYTNCETPVCTNCGKSDIIKQGFSYTKTASYQKFQCKTCGTWLRSRVTEKNSNRKNILTQVIE